MDELGLIEKGDFEKYTLTKRRISLSDFAIIQLNFVLNLDLQLLKAND